MTEKKQKKLRLVLILLTIILIYIFPYTWDDWAWGSSFGVQRLKVLFDNYNGRYLGNILVMILTRSRVVKTIVMFLTYFAIVKLIDKLTDNKNWFITIILLLLMSVPIFRQAVVWTSGFANYVFSSLLYLLLIYLLRKNKTSEKTKVLFLAFATSLFVENLTILTFLTAIFVLAREIKLQKKITVQNIYFFIGSLLGSILMFSNSVYINIKNQEDGYRTMTFKLIEICRQAITNFNELIVQLILKDTILIISVLFILILGLKLKNKIKNKYFSFELFLITYSYFIFKYFYPDWSILMKYTYYLEMIFAALFILSFVSLLFSLKIQKIKKERIIMYILILLGYFAPLFLVTPVGPRNLFFVYVIFIIIIQELISIIVQPKFILKLKPLLIMFSIIITIFWLSIYSYIYILDNRRISHTISNSKNEVIELPILPYGHYVHGLNPNKDIFKERYLAFYLKSEANDNIKLNLLPYTEWVIKYKE